MAMHVAVEVKKMINDFPHTIGVIRRGRGRPGIEAV